MANGLTSLFNFSSNEDALREGARRRLELQSRAAARNVASVSAQSATNPAAIARNVNEAQAVERSRVGADFQSQLMQAQQADQQRAGQFVGSLLGTAGSILGTVIPGADIAGKAAQGITNGVTQAATSNAEFPAGSPGRAVMPNPQGQPARFQGMGQALGNPGMPQQAPAPQQQPMAPQQPQMGAGQALSAPPQAPVQPQQQQPQGMGQALATPPQGPSPTPTLPAPAAMAGVSPVIQGATPPPPVQGPTAPVGQIQERSRLEDDTNYMNTLQSLFQLQRR